MNIKFIDTSSMAKKQNPWGMKYYYENVGGQPTKRELTIRHFSFTGT
jgi:NADPH-dependent curcumin reductase CurA